MSNDRREGEEIMPRLTVLGITLVLAMLPVLVAAATVRNLSPDDAYSMVNKRDGLYLLDVRTPEEFHQARLAGASLIPISQLLNRLAEVPKDRPILVYCAVGSRSAQVVNYLARQGYPEVYNLYGGIYSWAQKGYPILRGE
jgi:rhodanese-related sulfurtransferase